jgi:hypothetical protein
VSECCGWWRMNEWEEAEENKRMESNNLGLPKQGFTMLLCVFCVFVCVCFQFSHKLYSFYCSNNFSLQWWLQ